MKPQSRPTLPSLKLFFNPVSKSSRAQGLVEFALILPVLLLLIMGLIEFGRLLFVNITVASTSREAARYGAVIGLTDGGIPHYQDCPGMVAAAKRVSSIAGFDPAQIAITFDHGPGTPVFAGCQSPQSPPSNVQVGDRVLVSVTMDYQPIVPLVNLSPIPITSQNSHTILKDVQVMGTLGATWTPWPTNTRVPTLTYTPTITPLPSDTPTPTITWTPTETGTITNTPTITLTPTVTITPTVTTTPTASQTFIPTQTQIPTATPFPSCPNITMGPVQYLNYQDKNGNAFGTGNDEALVMLNNTGLVPKQLSSITITWVNDHQQALLKTIDFFDGATTLAGLSASPIAPFTVTFIPGAGPQIQPGMAPIMLVFGRDLPTDQGVTPDGTVVINMVFDDCILP